MVISVCTKTQSQWNAHIPSYSKSGMWIGPGGIAGTWPSSALGTEKVTLRWGGKDKRWNPLSSTATTSEALMLWVERSVRTRTTNFIFSNYSYLIFLSLPPSHLPTAALEWHLLEKVETENPQTVFCLDLATLKIAFGTCFLLTEV